MDKLLTSKEIKELREEWDLTQQELAETVGVSRSTIQEWEAGNLEQRRDVLIELTIFRNTYS